MANRCTRTTRKERGNSKKRKHDGKQNPWFDQDGRLTSAVLGTDSQKTSILISPRVVCSVTDMANVHQLNRSAHH